MAPLDTFSMSIGGVKVDGVVGCLATISKVNDDVVARTILYDDFWSKLFDEREVNEE